VGISAGAVQLGRYGIVETPESSATELLDVFRLVPVVIDATTAGESATLRIGNHATNTIRATGINTATPAFFHDWLPASASYASDAAAATGGVAVGQIYRNGSAVMCRIS
jgi:hypothetical protein